MISSAFRLDLAPRVIHSAALWHAWGRQTTTPQARVPRYQEVPGTGFFFSPPTFDPIVAQEKVLLKWMRQRAPQAVVAILPKSPRFHPTTRVA